jgi:hypothetical protein
MKAILLTASFVLVTAIAATAQTLAPDQNPSFMVSQARYMQMADSINSWHGTTVQNTYKAIDYYQDKLELRANRKAWRRELRMERARNSGWYNGYSNDYYYPYNSFSRPWGGNRWGNYRWSALPLAASLGWWYR